jgi:hypothetical protein
MALKNTYDTDAILFGILKNDAQLVSMISGGIYAGQRPDNSIKEDVTVNTIDLTQEYEPQIGTSNVNIHVPDKLQTIGSVQMKIEDRIRLKTITSRVIELLRNARFVGLRLIVTNQTTIREAEISQHFVNIRIDWNIHDLN